MHNGLKKMRQHYWNTCIEFLPALLTCAHMLSLLIEVSCGLQQVHQKNLNSYALRPLSAPALLGPEETSPSPSLFSGNCFSAW